jgi:WD40 repeat protein
VVADAGRGWVEHVAAAPWGAIAWAESRAAACMLPDRTLLRLELPSSCGGLAFAPKGQRLAVAHYGGVKLWSPSQSLHWGGSHIGATWSPDARFLLTPMQESALHGWRLSDKANMHMGGYPANARSLSWSRNGRLLATSGSQGALVWPFKGKDGPISQQADEFARQRSLTTAVAFHPKRDLLAVGYANGLVTLVNIVSGRALVLRRGDDGAIDHLTWSLDGRHLAYASIEGFCGITELEGLIHERLQ